MLFLIIAIVLVTIFVVHVCKSELKVKEWESDENENFDCNDENESKKFVHMGMFTVIRRLFLTLLWSQESSTSSDTVFNKTVERLRLPSGTHKFKFFRSNIVYIRSYKTLKEFLCNDSCIDRLSCRMTDYLFKGPGKGILFNSGNETWKELRKYTVKTLGQLGFGKNDRMSGILSDQLSDLLENLENQRKSTGNKIQVRELFTLPVINIVWCIVGGEKFSQDDENFLILHKHVETFTKVNLMGTVLVDCMPQFVINILDAIGFQCKAFFTALNQLNLHFEKYIDEKQRIGVKDETSMDFVERFLIEIEKHKDNAKLNKIYSKDQLAAVLTDLFAAGMDTTSKYLESALMYMVLNPHVQAKVKNEIDSVIGNSSQPSYAVHRKNMPYTQATMAEIHRMANVLPQIARAVNRDFKIGDENIKKGTIIGNNAFFSRFDKSWKDPTVFRPERFLDSENNILADNLSRVMPFGMGVRVCPGESVATSSIFTLLTGILQRYTLTRAEENEFLGLFKGFVLVSHPEPFHVSLDPR